MRHGFKANAERISHAERAAFNLDPLGLLDAFIFLKSKNIIVWKIEDVPGISRASLKQLTINEPNFWSGMTIRENGRIAVILNSQHSITRQMNTLMHEWAHIKLDHKPSRVDLSEDGLLLLSDYPKEYEEEADWLAGAMLAPRDGLYELRKSGLPPDKLAEHFGVSNALINWRLRMTGIERQLFHRARR